MPDIDDFYAFKMTFSGNGSSGVKSNNLNNGNSGYNGCYTVLIVLATFG